MASPGSGFLFKIGGGQTFPTLPELEQQTASDRAAIIAAADAFKHWHLYQVTANQTATANLERARVAIRRIPGGTR